MNLNDIVIAFGAAEVPAACCWPWSATGRSSAAAVRGPIRFMQVSRGRCTGLPLYVRGTAEFLLLGGVLRARGRLLYISHNRGTTATGRESPGEARDHTSPRGIGVPILPVVNRMNYNKSNP